DRWREREPEQQRRKRVHASPNALPQDRVLRHVGRHPHWFPPHFAPYSTRLTSDQRARTARYQTTVPVSAAPDVGPVPVASSPSGARSIDTTNAGTSESAGKHLLEVIRP